MNSNFLRLVALAATLAVPCSAFAAIKCWTNKEGVRECGNMVPPEYAQKETRTVNQRGITVDVRERAKTPAELEQERASREAEERRVAEEQRRQHEQAVYDRMLLSTFTTEEELIAAGERSTSAIDATIEITNANIATLERKQSEYQGRVEATERSGKPLPDGLRDDLASVDRQIAERRAYVESKEREKAQLNLKYEADLKRFRELKTVRPR